MGTKDKRVDAYIAKSADFGKPILTHIRAAVHESCPDVEEAIKWSTPAFMYRGSPLGMMVAFKEHCALRFWNEKMVIGDAANAESASAFARVTSLSGESFSPSHRREYVEWITEAKSDETRERRLAQAIEWMAEGKSRHWKYK